MYNTTNLSSASNFGELLSSINTLSGNVFGVSLLLVIWIFVFMGVQDSNRVKTATASFITMIASGLFLVLGLVTPAVMWIVGLALASSLVFLYVNARD